jgi:hypothetical protein
MAQGSALPSLIAISLFLAGCVAGESSTTPSTTIAGPATVDESTGGIEGLVTDDQIAPIAGAMVGLTDAAGIETVTDAGGRFSLSNVPPGNHQLAVQKLGYESAAKKVDVVLGEVTQGLQIVLVPLAVKEPYPEVLIHKGIIKNGVGVILTATCTNCGTAETFYAFKGGLPEDMSALAVEATWRTADYLGIDVLDRSNGGGVYWRIRDKSPIHYIVDACGSYLDPPYYASKPMPCDTDGSTSDNKIQAETWYIGGFQQETHNLDPVCRGSVVLAYKAGCYGLGYVPELVFTDYYTIFHGEKPGDIATYSALPDA